MKPPAYAAALVRVLQGPLYADSSGAWDLLLCHRQAVEDYFGNLGLDVLVAEHDDLAFLRKLRVADGSVRPAPRGADDPASIPGRDHRRAPQ